MKPLHTYISEEAHERIRKAAFEQKVSMSSLIRAMLENFDINDVGHSAVEYETKPYPKLTKGFHPVPKLGKSSHRSKK